MGPKKKGGRSNKKKQKNQASATSSSQPRIVSTTDSNSQQQQQPYLLPTFHTENANPPPNKKDTTGGIYERYKKCTQNFRDWMTQVLPHRKFDHVDDLSKGVQQLLNQNKKAFEAEESCPMVVIAPLGIMENLTTSIKYRELMSETKYGNQQGDNDDGHVGDVGRKYMIETLKYCRQMLRVSRRVARVAIKDAANKNNDKTVDDNAQDEDETSVADEIGGRFHALVLDDSDDEGEEDDQFAVVEEEMIRQGHFPDIQAPVPPTTPFHIEDLINGDDRFQAIAFLQSMEDLMGMVNLHYCLLKEDLRGQDSHDTGINTSKPYNNWLQLLMECAAVSNMATETVFVMETSLAVNHPHLSSFYHVLAVVFFYPIVAEIQQAIRPERLGQEPHLAKIFVGDIVECFFHNRGGVDMIPARVKRFVKQSGMPFDVADQFAQIIAFSTQIEIQLELEVPMNETFLGLGKSMGITPHMWLRRDFHLGGDRSLLNTHNILQKVLDLVQAKTKLTAIPGYWGSMFHEGSNPARRIRGDMDELLACDILPELIELCKRAPIRSLPNSMALMPVLDLLARQIRNGNESPIPVSLTFGLHALLTSIMVLQGDGDLARIATYSKGSYNKLFAQLQDESQSEAQNTPVFYYNVNLFKQVVDFGKPVSPPGSRTAEDHAFWNPLIGGENLLYGTYICSIGLGSATVDTLGQLRFTLHLYNALRKLELIQDVPFLKDIDKVFDKTKAVWVGGRPETGSFAKHFYLAWGMSISEANRLASILSRGDVPTESIKLGRDATRNLDEILPEKFSASYRRLVQRDFSHDQDDYTFLNASDAAKKHEVGLIDQLSRVNMTRDSMDDDEDWVIPTNFVVVGSILIEFIHALSEHMGWEPRIRHLIATCPDNVRNSRRTTGRKPRVGGFETSDLNLEWQTLFHFVAALLGGLDHHAESSVDPRAVNLFDCNKAAMFMTGFFKDISKERYTFLLEGSKDDSATAASPMKNPLEGSYLYGRTGRTMSDPLAAFWYCRHSKSGERVSRLIKPGKYTPYDADGELYVENGRKLERQQNGRYRHVASYSIKELVAIGWDGAMYVSTNVAQQMNGLYVPFISGYVSDSDDSYDPIDVQAGKRIGVIGLPSNEDGLYMQVPGHDLLAQLNSAR